MIHVIPKRVGYNFFNFKVYWSLWNDLISMTSIICTPFCYGHLALYLKCSYMYQRGPTIIPKIGIPKIIHVHTATTEKCLTQPQMGGYFAYVVL